MSSDDRGGVGAAEAPTPSLFELARVYLGISLLGFGGPNAHLALMLDEVVERRGWLTRERFLELMAVTNLLPGPNSSEVAIHVGYAMRGWRGALTTGLSFLLPTFLMVTAFSALYFRWGTLPQVEAIFWGVQPVIVAIVLSAGVKIGRAGVKTGTQAALAVGGAVVSLVSGLAIVPAMLVGGALTAWSGRPRAAAIFASGVPLASLGAPLAPESPARSASALAAEGLVTAKGFVTAKGLVASALAATAAGVAATGTLLTVFLLHLGIGSVLFGGGYVLVALLEPYAVGRLGWLTAGQFLDGVALTQAVPGPISTLSAFVGYAAAGVPGAILGTAGIYLPAFAAVLLTAPRLERVRDHPGVRRALDGVVAVAAGAVLGVGVDLALAAIGDAVTFLLAALALLGATWKKVPALWLVALGLAVGVVRALLA